MDDSNTNPYAASVSIPAKAQNTSNGICIIAAVVVGIANVGAVGTILTLVSTPTGAAIRPMGHTMLAAMFALLGLAIGAPLSIAAVWKSRRSMRAIGLCLLIVSLAPLPLASCTLHLLADFCGFSLKP